MKFTKIIMNNNFYLVNFAEIGGEEGYLTSLEINKNIPFEVKRVYYIYNIRDCNVIRGKHAHKNLQQILLCINGSCKVSCENKNGKEIFELNQKNQGLYIKDLVWREMFAFSKDCVLLVLASHLYDESDYIRNYDDFLRYATNNS